VLALLTPASLHAQWQIGVAVGQLSFHGGSTDTSATNDAAQLRPSSGLAFAVELERHWDRWGGELGVLSAGTGVEQESADFITIAKHAMHLYEILPGVSYVLSNVWRLHAGPAFDLWKPEGDSERLRIGAHAAVSATWSFATRLSTALRAGLALTSSPFEANELPARFDPRHLWRRSLSVAMMWRL
jgi:hypothetical protein